MDGATPSPYRPKNRTRFVTATSLFDGHDASINIMRRMIQGCGAEVVHLGHNRSVEEIVTAALEEDVQGIAVTSYQGGHTEYFKYMVDLLRERGGGHIKVFGGGGGVIIPAEIRALEDYGVTRIYSPEDGQKMGLQGMINEVVELADFDLCNLESRAGDDPVAALRSGDRLALSRTLTRLEAGSDQDSVVKAAGGLKTPVLGITGTGGAGKSSLTDELLCRFRLDWKECPKIAVIAVDPSRRRTGGALLGDRIRFNALGHPNLYFRSMATRDSLTEVPAHLPGVIAACKLAGFDLVIVETPGTGQGNASIVPHVDYSLYVMTPEFGAASQLEKIEMLDLADFIAINKFERRGGEDALHDVRKQYQRNHTLFSESPESLPVFGTMAAHFNDAGVSALYQSIRARLQADERLSGGGQLPAVAGKSSNLHASVVPPERERYLAEISETVRGYHAASEAEARKAHEAQALRTATRLAEAEGEVPSSLKSLASKTESSLSPESKELLKQWPSVVGDYSGEEHVVKVRGREIRTPLARESLSGSRIPKVALPRFRDDGDLLRWLRRENLPGRFPFTAGVFAFKRDNEDPTRMFAGEGNAHRTNQRFRRLSEGMPAKRLSTAFDSVTLYGADPDPRPDIYGKVGNSGVSIATLDDMQVLYSGFDLTDPTTSVSMTINGPAPILLAMFFNTAIDQRVEALKSETGKAPGAEQLAAIRAEVLSSVRGTVQADILKEDQGQNTCIFSTEFALKMMGDIQEYFVEHDVWNFYSVSISGYHIAEAGANPITQLAFTLANGFTYVESYLARGMSIDDFAPNLSFFFSNGMDPEYSVIGRVARRIWAVAMRERYGANERSQKLKYHIQTSGRSLHAQEIDFNDIRTTLQALIAIYDNCNSLHTNAYDEAITTPTEESVRRAMAIQLIINREWGLAMNENPNQGSFLIEELTDLVEEAVLKEFEALSTRGGVLGAMETGYQRSKIQDESMYYEHRKNNGSHPIIGVNTFLNPRGESAADTLELARSTEDEKNSQLQRLRAFQQRNREESQVWAGKLRQAVIEGRNTFEVLMDAVRYCSLGEITAALYEVGGRYRRNM